MFKTFLPVIALYIAQFDFILNIKNITQAQSLVIYSIVLALVVFFYTIIKHIHKRYEIKQFKTNGQNIFVASMITIVLQLEVIQAVFFRTTSMVIIYMTIAEILSRKFPEGVLYWINENILHKKDSE